MADNTKYVERGCIIEKQFAAEEKIRKDFAEGNYTFEQPLVVKNPYLIAPLTALVAFRTETACAVTLTVKGKEAVGDIRHTFPKAKEHFLPVVGLYEDYCNIIEIELYQGPVNQVNIQTEALPDSYHQVKSMKASHEIMGDNMIFTTPSLRGETIAVDYAGEIRWALTQGVIWGFVKLSNGRLFCGSEQMLEFPYYMGSVIELDLIGKIYKEYQIPGGFHHDLVELEDGNLLILSDNLEAGSVEDTCVLVDRQTGEILRLIDFKNFMKPGFGPSGSFTEEDWFHCNSLAHDRKTNTLIFSARHLDALIAIDFYTEEIKWIIGDPTGWSEEYQKYFLRQPDGKAFKWQYEQHGVKLLEDGTVICFDNGHFGSKIPEEYILNKDNGSRGMRFKINLEKREVELIWEFGKQLGQEFFSRYISNVEFLGEGHYMIHSGGISLYNGVANEAWEYFTSDDPLARVESRTIEVLDGKIVTDLTLGRNSYRGQKFPLYNTGENMNLVFGKGEVLGRLNETIPDAVIYEDMEDNGCLPEEDLVIVLERHNGIEVKGQFDPSDEVMITLKNHEEELFYAMPSFGPMAGLTGRLVLPLDDLRNRFVQINKMGLSGKYEVNVVLNGKHYSTGISIESDYKKHEGNRVTRDRIIRELVR